MNLPSVGLKTKDFRSFSTQKRKWTILYFFGLKENPNKYLGENSTLFFGSLKNPTMYHNCCIFALALFPSYQNTPFNTKTLSFAHLRILDDTYFFMRSFIKKGWFFKTHVILFWFLAESNEEIKILTKWINAEVILLFRVKLFLACVLNPY